MSFPRIGTVACAAVMFLSPIPAVLTAQDGAAPRPGGVAGVVVGTIDFGKAFDAYPRTAKEHERLRQMAETSQKQIDQYKQRVDELRASLQVIAEGTFEHEMKQLDLEGAMRDQQNLAKLLSDQLELEQMRVQLSIWADIEAAVAQLAKDRGVDLVLRADPIPPLPEKARPRDVRNRAIAFDQRQIWFAASRLDLTSDLIKLLQVWPLDGGRKSATEQAPAERPAAGKPADGGGN